MALDMRPEALNARIDSLRVGYIGHQQAVLARNRAYLRAFSPGFNADLKEHDQWADPIKNEDVEHYRSSYNLTRAVVELWTSLEMSEFPAIRWWERFIPTPVPSLDAQESEGRQTTYRAQKLVARQIATIREQTLVAHIRRAKLPRHAYRAVLRKNVYGHSWLKTTPDLGRRTFRVFSGMDPSTVYPVWSAYDGERLDALLCVTRQTTQSVNAEFPGFLQVSADGLTLTPGSMYYQPTVEQLTEADRAFVWVETTGASTTSGAKRSTTTATRSAAGSSTSVALTAGSPASSSTRAGRKSRTFASRTRTSGIIWASRTRARCCRSRTRSTAL